MRTRLYIKKWSVSGNDTLFWVVMWLPSYPPKHGEDPVSWVFGKN